MQKAEKEMLLDIIGWPISAEQRLAMVRNLIEATPERAAAAPAPEAPPAKKAAKKTMKKAAARPVGRPRKRTVSERVSLWNELKKLAPEKAAKLSFNEVTAETLKPLVAEAKKK